MKQLSEWPRPSPNTGLGLHLSADCYDGRYKGAINGSRDRDIDIWKVMGITWLKVLTGSDAQLTACEAFAKAGFQVIVRFYAPAINESTVPVDQLKIFADRGVVYFENYTNEPEIEWGRPPTPDVIASLADQHIRFADSCARAGVIPCTPAIQGDRLDNWFKPFCEEIIRRGRKDALEGSVIAGHWRPGNYRRGGKLFPPDSPPIDETHGGVGFVFRSYEKWDEYIRGLLGSPLPLLGTEAGYEPSEVDGDIQLHTQLNVQLAQMTWGEALFCQCYWLAVPGGMGNNSAWMYGTHGWMPIIDAFTQMPKPMRGVAAQPPPVVISLETVVRQRGIERWNKFPWLKKEAIRRGYCTNDSSGEFPVQHDGQRYIGQLFVSREKRVVVGCKEGEYSEDKTFVVEL